MRPFCSCTKRCLKSSVIFGKILYSLGLFIRNENRGTTWTDQPDTIESTLDERVPCYSRSRHTVHLRSSLLFLSRHWRWQRRSKYPFSLIRLRYPATSRPPGTMDVARRSSGCWRRTFTGSVPSNVLRISSSPLPNRTRS